MEELLFSPSLPAERRIPDIHAGARIMCTLPCRHPALEYIASRNTAYVLSLYIYINGLALVGNMLDRVTYKIVPLGNRAHLTGHLYVFF